MANHDFQKNSSTPFYMVCFMSNFSPFFTQTQPTKNPYCSFIQFLFMLDLRISRMLCTIIVLQTYFPHIDYFVYTRYNTSKNFMHFFAIFIKTKLSILFNSYKILIFHITINLLNMGIL